MYFYEYLDYWKSQARKHDWFFILKLFNKTNAFDCDLVVRKKSVVTEKAQFEQQKGKTLRALIVILGISDYQNFDVGMQKEIATKSHDKSVHSTIEPLMEEMKREVTGKHELNFANNWQYYPFFEVLEYQFLTTMISKKWLSEKSSSTSVTFPAETLLDGKKRKVLEKHDFDQEIQSKILTRFSTPRTLLADKHCKKLYSQLVR